LARGRRKRCLFRADILGAIPTSARAGNLTRAGRGPQAQASPFMEGASVYIDLAMTWGAKHGVGVLLDLQAAPGSQNGCAVMCIADTVPAA